MYSTVLVVVRARVRGKRRELAGVGALAILICRRVCHGIRGAYRGGGGSHHYSMDLKKKSLYFIHNSNLITIW